MNFILHLIIACILIFKFVKTEQRMIIVDETNRPLLDTYLLTRSTLLGWNLLCSKEKVADHASNFLQMFVGIDLQRPKKQRIRPAKPAHRFGFCSGSGGERKKAISFTSGGSLGEPITRPEKVSFGRLIGPRVKAHQIIRIRSRNNPSYLSGNKGDVKGFRNHIDSLGGQNYGFHYFFYLICIFHRESSPSSSLFSNHFILLATTTFLDFAIKRL